MSRRLSRRFWAPAIVGAILLLSGLFGVAALVRQPGILPKASSGGPRDALSALEAASLLDGDVIFRKGVGSASDLVSSMVGEGMGISHCGMIRLRNGEPWVVHTLNGSLTGTDGVQAQPLHEFNTLSAPGSIAVYRPRMDERTRQAVLQRLDQSLAQRLPFDNEYQLQSRNSLYCSELVLDAFEAGGLFRSGESLLMVYQFLSFRNFMDPVRFDCLLSHNPALLPKDS